MLIEGAVVVFVRHRFSEPGGLCRLPYNPPSTLSSAQSVAGTFRNSRSRDTNYVYNRQRIHAPVPGNRTISMGLS